MKRSANDELENPKAKIAPPSEPGSNLRLDLEILLSNPAYHDLTIRCSDGVVLGACRAVLAARSTFFRSMLFNGMRESISAEVSLPSITSDALSAVLRYLCIEELPVNITSDYAVAVYHAARFLLLPDLAIFVIQQVESSIPLGVASALINEAVDSGESESSDKELLATLVRPFCSRELKTADFETLNEEALKLILTESARTTDFKTNEYNLVLCVIDWAWSRCGQDPRDKVSCLAERLNDVDWFLIERNSEVKIDIIDPAVRATLVRLVQHIDLTLICAHYLSSLTEMVDVLAGDSLALSAFRKSACANTICPPNHPARHRGLFTWGEWDREWAGNNVHISEDGMVVECSGSPRWCVARLSQPFVAELENRYEWDMVVEVDGTDRDEVHNAFGLVDDTFTRDGGLYHGRKKPSWTVVFQNRRFSVFTAGQSKSTEVYNGLSGRSGDIITFHLNMGDRTCGMSINGNYRGIIWHCLPSKVYVAVELGGNARYRYKAFRSQPVFGEREKSVVI